MRWGSHNAVAGDAGVLLGMMGGGMAWTGVGARGRLWGPKRCCGCGIYCGCGAYCCGKYCGCCCCRRRWAIAGFVIARQSKSSWEEAVGGRGAAGSTGTALRVRGVRGGAAAAGGHICWVLVKCVDLGGLSRVAEFHPCNKIGFQYECIFKWDGWKQTIATAQTRRHMSLSSQWWSPVEYMCLFGNRGELPIRYCSISCAIKGAADASISACKECQQGTTQVQEKKDKYHLITHTYSRSGLQQVFSCVVVLNQLPIIAIIFSELINLPWLAIHLVKGGLLIQGSTYNILDTGSWQRHSDTNDEVLMPVDNSGYHDIVSHLNHDRSWLHVARAIKFPLHLQCDEWGRETMNSFGDEWEKWFISKRGTEGKRTSRSNFWREGFDGLCINTSNGWCGRWDRDIDADLHRCVGLRPKLIT